MTTKKLLAGLVCITVVGVLVIIAILNFTNIQNSIKENSYQYCVGGAASANQPNPTRQTVCYSSPAKASEDLAIVTSEENLIDTFARMFPGAPPLQFVDSGKPFCVAMIVNANRREIKAQCFDSEKTRDAAIRLWQTTPTPRP